MAKELTQKQLKFVQKKQLGNRFVPIFLILLAFLVLGSFTYFFIFQPIMVNPLFVSAQLKNKAINPEISNLLLLFFPILLCLFYLVLVIFFIVVLAYYQSEKKFLKIINLLLE